MHRSIHIIYRHNDRERERERESERERGERGRGRGRRRRGRERERGSGLRTTKETRSTKRRYLLTSEQLGLLEVLDVKLNPTVADL